MEKETVNQETAKTSTEAEKTFSQSELDAIISDRLKREREKYVDYESLKEKAAKLDEIEEASKTELQKATERAAQLESELTQLRRDAEIRQIREKVAAETGVPATLMSGETEEACVEQAKAIMEFKANMIGYPSVKDAGEVTKEIKGSTRQQFANWASEALN